MANRRGGGQNIGSFGCTDPIVEKIMNMPGEDSLNLEVSDKFDEPRSRRFGNIVVMFGLMFVMEKQRVVLEKKSASSSAEFRFKPLPLARLVCEVTVQQLAVNHYKTAAPVLKGMPIWAEFGSICSEQFGGYRGRRNSMR